MQQLVDQTGRSREFVLDSAGTHSYHQGELPDARMRAHARGRGYVLTHRSRPVRAVDFERFDLIVAMDDQNIEALRRLAPTIEDEAKIHRMTDYCRRFEGADHVPDPYYGGDAGFEHVIDLLEDACEGLLRTLL